MFIDAHHHFWRYNPAEYAWIGEDMPKLRRDYLPETLEEVTRAHGIDGVVSVQARESLDETRFLLDLAQGYARVRGVVGWVPLREPAVGEILDALSEDALFKGAREVMQGRADTEYFENPSFHDGLRELTQRGLPYDLLVYADQLPATIQLVDAHQGQRFVLDHVAKPVIRNGAFPEAWAREMRSLAERGNVVCKLSGMVTEVRDPEWDAALLRPYFETALDCFGPERLMFGSDWPVCLLRAEYGAWLQCALELAGVLSEDERTALFGGTAAAAYGL